MNVFYTNRIEGNLAFLAEAEAKHLGKVMRKKVGDTIHLIDGVGGRYTGEIVELEKRSATIQVLEGSQEADPPARLHLAVAPPKNNSRLEWLLEKVTEIGVDEIWPFVSFHSERKIIKTERLEKILLAATKQSLKARLPRLHALQGFTELLDELVSLFPERVEKYIAYIDPQVNLHLQDNYSAGKDVVILIGPEGGFSAEEVALAKEKGFRPVSLGPARLRTETAGLVATTIVQLKNQTI
ncbi:MAG TPA: RsmE family RNA methyltransferase [Saprospiraceae bacterium]|nr:RsmE family RNA methyltransferase [Saprospiraceae bacterium]